MKKLIFLIFTAISISFSLKAQHDTINTAIPDSVVNMYTQTTTGDTVDMSDWDQKFMLQTEIQTQKLYKNLFLIGFVFMTMLSILLFYINNVKIKQIMNLIKIQERQIDIKSFEIEKLSIILHHTNEGIAITDDKGKIMWNNESFKKIHGFGDEDIQEKDLKIFEYDNENINQLIEKLKNKRQAVQFSFETKNNKNQTIYVQRKILPIADEKNKVLSYAIIDEDLTALKLAVNQSRKK